MMKNNNILLLIMLCSSFLFSCKDTPQDSKKKSVELMTTQTMGLAYLEEFKLDEAEKEFLKFINWHRMKNWGMQIWDWHI